MLKPGKPHQTPGPLSYAKVALNRPLAQAYTYYIPDSFDTALRIGSLVQVPLRNDLAEGVVVDIMDEPGTKVQTKAIARHIAPEYHIDGAMIELGRWMAGYYFCSLGEALGTVSMIGLNDVGAKTRTHLALHQPDWWLTQSREAGPDGQKATLGHKQVITALLAGGNRPLPPEELRELAEVGDGVLDTMLKRGWLAKVQEAVEIVRGILNSPEIARSFNLTERPPRVYFDELNAESLNIRASYWFTPVDYWAYLEHCQKVNLELLRQFEQAGIELAFPTRTLYLAGDPKRRLRIFDGEEAKVDGEQARAN
jgi:hypothetical protein